MKTFSRTAASVLLGFLVASTAARARQSEDAAPQAQQASPSASIPSYPNTAQGLEKFMKDMMKAAKNGDHDVVAAYAKSLVLPDAESWFKSVFGDEHGARLAAVSDRVRSEIELSAPDAVTKFLSEDRTRVEAVRFDDSCNSRATDTEYPFLLLRERPEPLYDVRFGDGQTESVWAYFAYVDGGFRYIGNLQRNSARPAPRRRASSAPQSSAQQPGESADQEPPPPPRIRVGGNVEAAQLIHQDIPKYPHEAKSQGIQGIVILHAIIAKDGTVKDLDVIQGPCILVQPALKAVEKWRYRPTMLKGDPVEVDTTISVVYTLHH